jgi:GT2 family glycosyltransferase
MNKIFILLPVHNRREITRLFISYLRLQTFQNYHLVLIDDGSSDGTEEMVREAIESLTVIKGQGSWWWAGSLQQGINWLKGNSTNLDDIILMINDDTKIEADFLEKAVEILSSEDRLLLLAQAFGLKTDLPDDLGIKVNLKTLSFRQAQPLEEINCLSTRGLFLRYSDLLETGDFHPRILPHYLSDYEFTIRAYKKGFKLKTHPELRIWINEQTTGQSHFKELNFLLFLRRYFSNRSVVNPLHWTVFAILACPKFYLPQILFKIWWGTTVTILKRATYIVFWSLAKVLNCEDRMILLDKNDSIP